MIVMSLLQVPTNVDAMAGYTEARRIWSVSYKCLLVRCPDMTVRK
jgi:hypothetical protein